MSRIYSHTTMQSLFEVVKKCRPAAESAKKSRAFVFVLDSFGLPKAYLSGGVIPGPAPYLQRWHDSPYIVQMRD
jgi:hypothetical protein